MHRRVHRSLCDPKMYYAMHAQKLAKTREKQLQRSQSPDSPDRVRCLTMEVVTPDQY